MRIIIVLMMLLSFNLIIGQSFLEAYENTRHQEPYDHLNGLYSDEYATLTGNPNEWSKISGVFYEFDDIRLEKLGVDGTVMLFDDWKNTGAIYASNKKYIISNINYNIGQEKFMSQLETDSTFVFDFDGIDKVEVNNRTFKRVYNASENNHRVYEILYADKNVSLLKSYSVFFMEASPNPMLNRTKNKIKKTSQVFIFKNGSVLPIKLNKKSILGLANKDGKESLETYVKANKLSYKKEAHVQQMLQFIAKTDVKSRRIKGAY